MKFKKALSLVLISAMTCSLAACGGSTTTTSQNNNAADDTAGSDDTTASAENNTTAGADDSTADPAPEAGDDVKEADLSDIIPNETVTLTVCSPS